MTERPLVTEADIAVVEEIYDRFNRNDLALDRFAEDVEIHQMGRIIDTAGVFHGHVGLKESAVEVAKSFPQIEWTPHGFHPFRSTISVPVTARGRARISGAEVEVHIWHVWTMRNGRVVRWDVIDADYS